MSPELHGRLLFLENYDMRVGRGLVQGVDVWLNTPRPPLEASGTSGMKAAMNGGLNCSVRDGWWCEGYDASHGWALGDATPLEGEEADKRDADSLYRTLADEIAPIYYRRDDDGCQLERSNTHRRGSLGCRPFGQQPEGSESRWSVFAWGRSYRDQLRQRNGFYRRLL